ncbi:MAG TPA: CRISPR-associated endonuclease Cas3'' [Mogibacterium sp.]|nr:CRISPR-associated endonuclease Cas3'' [Mogibacterium sp.]
MEYLAHSKKEEIPAQSYSSHVKGVFDKTIKFAEEVEKYAKNTDGQLRDIAARAAISHDIGKLLSANQEVLRSEKSSPHLPINHVDAGVAKIKKDNAPLASIIAYSHHRGLPNYYDEAIKGEHIFRDECEKTLNLVDNQLDELCEIHNSLVSETVTGDEICYAENRQVFLRMALSCLADADHSDTAMNYRQYPENDSMPLLRAEERLKQLDDRVSKLGNGDERSLLRAKMYQSCRDSKQTGAFSSCDSPVGSGKTTAVMAHLLKQAIERRARRIFVVLPFTSIITQSVNTYRDYLVLPGEDPEKVVAELHHRVDCNEYDTYYLTSLWRAPIIVTTAVAFFETLASNRPSTLRRLHELPGSVIFVDESHAALPVKLLPTAWLWMNVLADEWGCYWVLASGSLVRFWKIPEIMETYSEIGLKGIAEVPKLVDEELRNSLMSYEKDRIYYRFEPEIKNLESLVEWVTKFSGPRLLIVNTVNNAAIIADHILKCNDGDRNKVEHLSTAITSEDRSKTIERIRKRLKNKEDQDWTLVATSCVEAGVDFSFRVAFRELSSLLSLLQTAGRVNRHGLHKNAEIWSFRLLSDKKTGINENPGLRDSQTILRSYFDKGIKIEPSLSTMSMKEELNINGNAILNFIKEIQMDEMSLNFEYVAEKFVVIDNDTVPVVVDKKLADEIRNGYGNWQELQKKSVSIRKYKAKEMALEEIKPGIYKWNRKYDDFIGYMAGVIEEKKFENDFLSV